MELKDQLAAVRSAVNGYKLSQLLISAQDYGLFEKLTEGPKTAAALAEDANCDPEHVRRLVNALVASKVLVLEDGSYLIAEDWSVLRSDNPSCQLGYLKYASIVKDRWALLSRALRDDRVSQESVALISGGDKDASSAFIAAMDANALPIAKRIAADWHFDNHTFIDVGGGSGIYSIAVATANTKATGVIFDLPGITDLAQNAVSIAGLSDRLSIASGDYNTRIPGNDYDDAFLFAIVHQQGETENKTLLSRIHNALKPGGRLFLTSFFTNDDGTAPLFSAFFGVEMTVMIPNGRIYSNREIEEIITSAGFIDIQKADTLPGPATLYTAIRP